MVEHKKLNKNITGDDDNSALQNAFSSPVAAQLSVLGVGAVITILLYVFFNTLIQGLVQDEYHKTTRIIASDVSKTIHGFKGTLGSVTEMMRMALEEEKVSLIDQVDILIPNVSKFDQIAWLQKDAQGHLILTHIKLKSRAMGTARKFYHLYQNADLDRYVDEHDLFSKQGNHFLKAIPIIAKNADKPVLELATDKAFAVSRVIDPGAPERGVIIAVGSFGNMLGHEWFSQNDMISELRIVDVVDKNILFEKEDYNAESDRLSVQGQVYEISFAGLPLEMSLALRKDPKIYLLESLPIFLLVLGFSMAAVGAFFVHGRQKNQQKMMQVYKSLEQKNQELKREIIARVGLDETLQKTEAENRSIIDAVSDVIFETDRDGRLAFVNARWRAVTGFDADHSIGTELFQMLHPDDQARLREDFRLMVSGQGEAFRSFTRVRTKKGSFRAVELSISMIRRDQDKNIRVVGTLTDVEERRRAERALSEAEKKYRTIVENAAGGIFQLTPEGLYLSANPAMARILGYKDSDEILRNVKNAHEQIYVDSRARQAFLRDLENRGAINNFETQLYRKDGKIIWVNENIRVVRDDQNSTLFYEGSIEDITARKETDLELREAKMHSDLANRAKSEFLTNMSHELRTPLNSIIGFSEIIKNQSFGEIEPKAYWDYARDIHESGKGLLRVINEILDISKIEAGERQLNESIVDLHGVMEACIELLEVKIDAGRLTVANTIKNMPPIVAEELALKQIIMNLLSNAIKFTPEDGRITISSNMDNQGNVRLSITDTGVGLDEYEIVKALSPFGQIQNDMNRSNSGTGLGLTLADALIRLHGGELELFSQKGIGTTATIVIPHRRVKPVRAKTSVTQHSENIF